MEKEKLSKKQIIPLVIGVLTMVILVSSATYAYFRVSIGNTATSTTITGDIGGATLGTITLDGGGTNLYLGVSAYDMSETEKGTTYYSSTTEGSRETNVNNAGKTTYTATLNGDDTDSVMYACDYEFTITTETTTGTLSSMESLKDVELVFNGDIRKTIPLSEGEDKGTTGRENKINGTWFGFKKSNAEREFNAYLQLTNTKEEQNDLAGKNISVEIENTKWKCYLSENDELVGDAYAILQEIECGSFEDENGDGIFQETEECYGPSPALTFIRSEIPINVGDFHNESEVIEVYTGFEDQTYSSFYETPWSELENIQPIVIFEDEIRPISTSNWFMFGTINVTNLNTSLVTDMSRMFSYAGNDFNGPGEMLMGLETLDTSNVTNMSEMFAWANDTIKGINDWDVSKVTDMSYMFYGADLESLDLGNWNVSSVTDMSYIFAGLGNYGGNFVGDWSWLENWDVSNVTDMSYMFYTDNTTNLTLDLRNWDVSNVINMEYMFSCGTEGWNTGNYTLNLTGWDTSNVTNMSHMFYCHTELGNECFTYTLYGLDSWNTSNVTDMSAMFSTVVLNNDLNLSGWDVSNVTAYENFNTTTLKGTLIPPNFKTTT